MNDLIKTLVGVQRLMPTFQSNFSRRKAHWIAEAASRGYISCLSTGLNTGKWMITEKGLGFLNRRSSMKISKSFDCWSSMKGVEEILGDDFTSSLIDGEEQGRVKHDIVAEYGFFPLGETRDGLGMIGYHVNYSTSYNDGIVSVDISGPVVRREEQQVKTVVVYE